MLDPGIIDLVHHLGRQPPPVVEFAPSAVAPTIEKTERHVRRIEKWSSDWIRAAQDHFQRFRADYDANSNNTAYISIVDRAIDVFEKTIEEQAKQYRREAKFSRNTVNLIRSHFPMETARVRSERTRMLKAIARANLVRVELLQAMRGLRAQIDPGFETGPTFDNADDLDDFLRSAVV